MSVNVTGSGPESTVTLSTRREFDALGRAVRQTGPTTVDGEGPLASWQYDVNGDLIRHVQTVASSHTPSNASSETPALTATYEYDSHGRRSVSRKQGERPLLTVYDDWGRLTQQTGEDVGVVVNTYDGLGRLTHANASGLQQKMTYAPDGQVLTVEQSGELIEYQYDLQGNRVKERKSYGGKETEASFAFDPLEIWRLR